MQYITSRDTLLARGLAPLKMLRNCKIKTNPVLEVAHGIGGVIGIAAKLLLIEPSKMFGSPRFFQDLC